jgi:integrase
MPSTRTTQRRAAAGPSADPWPATPPHTPGADTCPLGAEPLDTSLIHRRLGAEPAIVSCLVRSWWRRWDSNPRPLDHLTDSLGRKRVRLLRPEDVESMLQRFADAGFSKSSLNKLRNTLGMALGWAERRGTAPRNVARIAEMPHGVRPAEEGRAMTGQQARAFAVACQESPFEALWLVSLYCGLRPGEAAALAWEDLDLDAPVVHVRRGLRRHPDGQLTVGPTKTAHSVRSLDLPEPVADAFRRRPTRAPRRDDGEPPLSTQGQTHRRRRDRHG